MYLLEIRALCSEHSEGNVSMDDHPVHLTLYVTRASAVAATKNLMKALGTTREDVAELKIIDVSTQPDLMNQEELADIPCLKVERGNDEIFVVVDLTDLQQVENALRGSRMH